MSRQQQQQQQVWLGLAGDLVGPSDALDFYTTKVGGRPVLPGSAPPAEALSGCICSVCGRPLSLLMQAYAPHPAAPERLLLVLGCTKLGCGKEAGCYKALRCQLLPRQQLLLPQPADAVAAEPQQQQQQAQQPAAAAAAGAAVPAAAAGVGFDALSAADDDWGSAGDWGAAPVSAAAAVFSSNAFDFSDLTQSLEAAGQQQAAATAAAAAAKTTAKQQPAANGGTGTSAADAGSSEPVLCCRGSVGPQLPEFYVYAEAEPDEAAAKAGSSKELHHVQQLLAAYEAAEAAAASGVGTSIATSTSAASNRQPQQQAAAAAADIGSAAGDGDSGSWAGEGYEEDQLRGVERGYLKFSKRLARQPQQCARYSLGGPLLWPKAQQPQPAPCPVCGSRRAFELQVMPPMMQLSIEAAHMALEQGAPVDPAVIDAVANWDWATVAVFTCQASCSSSTQPEAAPASPEVKQQQLCEVFVEEVCLINEQDCHTVLLPPVPGFGVGGEAGSATSAIAAASPAVAATGDAAEGGQFEDDMEEEDEER